MIGAILPWVIIGSSALLIMLFTAIKRDHIYTALLTISGLSIALITQLINVNTISYSNDLISINSTTSLLSALMILLALMLSLQLYPWLNKISDPKEEYYMLFLLACLGALVVVVSEHFASFFLGLEILTLSIVPMILYCDKDSGALEASIKYFVLSSIASAFILMGIGLIYFATGTLIFSEIPQQLAIGTATASDSELFFIVGSLMILLGISFKLSLAPCHLWVADIFEGAPLATTAVLATLAKAAVFTLFWRLLMISDWQMYPPLISVLSFVAILSMLAGNLLALLQSNILRLLAYSSIAHFGYLLLGPLAMTSAVALPSSESLAAQASIFYLCAYMLTLLGIFILLIHLKNQHKLESFHLDSLKGLYWREPMSAFVMTILMLSLAGIPLTIGFFGKFYLVMAAVNSQLWGLLGVLVIASIIGLFYYLRIIMIMLEKVTGKADKQTRSLQPMYILLMSFILLMVVGLGGLPNLLIVAIEAATIF